MKSKRHKEQHCILVIDANILIQDLWLEGVSWNHLKKHRFLMHTLVVPEVVLDEAAAHIERRADDLLRRIEVNGYTARLKAQYQILFNRKKRSKETAPDLAERYKEFIKKTLDSHNGILTAVPNVGLPTLLQRSISRKKPFNKGDKGFRDTLIWLGVVELVKEHQRVSFVSANTSDYSGADAALHDDLKQDLTGILPSHIHFRYFKGLHEFIAFMDRDGKASAEAFKSAIMTSGYRGFELDSWILENIDELLSFHELDGVEWTSLPYWAEDPRLIDLVDLVGIEAHSEKRYGKDKIELFCDIALVGIFQCSILYSTWKAIVHPRQIEWVDEDTSDTWTEVGIRSVATFMLRFIFDLEKIQVIEHEIVAISHDKESAIKSLEEIKRMNEEFIE